MSAVWLDCVATLLTLVPEVHCVFQAEGNERKTVFRHKGSKGWEDLNQDSSVRTDILLRHLRL